MLNMMSYFKLIIVIVLEVILTSHTYCSNLYGPSCPYLPAPTGKTPPCARPGKTFCEYPDGYPGELIMFLANQARFNYRTLVTDETKEHFEKKTGPYPSAKYPTSYKEIDITTFAPIHNDQFKWQNGGPELPYFNKMTNFSGNFFGYDAPASGHGGQFLRYKYISNIPRPHHFRDISRYFDPSSIERLSSPSLSEYRTKFPWKREANQFHHLHERVKRSELFRRHMREIRESLFKKNFTGEVKYKRTKRQDDGGFTGEALCRTRSSFIMPRAALNREGNWMYIVNMENTNQKYTQLVKSEVCASQTCSSICGLPTGYSSRCEQKYIQKRLVALQGQGDQLYTDVFWIPSCCVCTIQRN